MGSSVAGTDYAFDTLTLANFQTFDFEGLIGRLNSSSYVPPRDDPRYAALAARAREIFDAHQQNGKVAFEYDTRVFYGRMV